MFEHILWFELVLNDLDLSHDSAHNDRALSVRLLLGQASYSPDFL